LEGLPFALGYELALAGRQELIGYIDTPKARS
jgi:hypothetical protein